MSLQDKLHEIIDEAIIANPGQFPDGPDFLTTLEHSMEAMVDSGEADDVSLHPMEDGCWKLSASKGGDIIDAIRNADGGKWVAE
jgi:hypothetical protein